MARASVLGYPRMGPDRELKKALETFWKGNISEHQLRRVGSDIRRENWELMNNAGVDFIPSNDFSFYDTTLDLCTTLGLVPERYHTTWNGFSEVSLDTYFAMARGMQKDGTDVTAMEMSKWFDTNYHYIVPEFESGMVPSLSSSNIFHQYSEAAALGIKTRPVILGPVSFTLLGKPKYDAFDPVAFVLSLIPVYNTILNRLEALGCEWVQLDEPFLCMDLTDQQSQLFRAAYRGLHWSKMNIMLCTYMETLRENANLLLALPVQGVHLDLCRVSGKSNVASTDAAIVLRDTVEAISASDKVLSIGIVDGRNIWKNDFASSIDLVRSAVASLGPRRVVVSTSCSLLHCPVDIEREENMDPEVRGWLVFAKQKVSEVMVIAKAISEGDEVVEEDLAANRASLAARAKSTKVVDAVVQSRVDGIKDLTLERTTFLERLKLQNEKLQLPAYPTTTIGSFPQTEEIRRARALYRKGTSSKEEYDAAIKAEIEHAVKLQEDLGIDVLVHGEPERTDMVEYFGQNMKGFIFSEFGWVQSYGSRCVKPPILFGDVSRTEPITVEWAKFAQSLTSKPMKGMLTGPITILQWSFVRDDQSRQSTAAQLALAIRDEVLDLESAGIRVIQIDEAAIREGLPLRKADWNAYLKWAVDSFKIAASVVKDDTSIHTHMCYSEFNDIISSIADMDADCISIETSRSQMELLDAFADFKYPNLIGPGVYDIHSPRVPSEEEILALLEKASKVIPTTHIWVNPDCGLKTRGYKEVTESLAHMVSAAKKMRDIAPEEATVV